MKDGSFWLGAVIGLGVVIYAKLIMQKTPKVTDDPTIGVATTKRGKKVRYTKPMVKVISGNRVLMLTGRA